jgi:hypothetical protein
MGGDAKSHPDLLQKILKWYVERGFPLKQALFMKGGCGTQKCWTALMHAVKSGYVENVQILLQRYEENSAYADEIKAMIEVAEVAVEDNPDMIDLLRKTTGLLPKNNDGVGTAPAKRTR